ncbi:MAG: LytR C-terminal domain-containing protein [Acidimicrobiales bacterium]
MSFDLELPDHGTGIRAARRAAQKIGLGGSTAPSRRWMVGFVSTIVVLVFVAGGLAFVGVQTLRDSTTGRRITSLDPTQPGFEGALTPTPTLVVVHQRDGELRSAAVLALTGDDRGGSILLLPTTVKVGDRRSASTLAVTFAFAESPTVARGAAEAVAGVGVDDMVVLDDQRWATLVAPVAPLAVGDVMLAADEVGPWLDAPTLDEGEPARLDRQRLFWQSWIAAVAASGDPGAVPGELDVGVGRFIRGLAAGPLRIEALPVTDVTERADTPLFEVDREALRVFLTDLVPFPNGTALAPRTRVRLLDGTGDPDHVASVASNVVASDSTIVVVGNADGFDYTTTEIRYHQPGQRLAAERLRDALDAGRVVEDVRPIDAFDVTIVLGTDT